MAHPMQHYGERKTTTMEPPTEPNTDRDEYCTWILDNMEDLLTDDDSPNLSEQMILGLAVIVNEHRRGIDMALGDLFQVLREANDG